MLAEQGEEGSLDEGVGDLLGDPAHEVDLHRLGEGLEGIAPHLAAREARELVPDRAEDLRGGIAEDATADLRSRFLEPQAVLGEDRRVVEGIEEEDPVASGHPHAEDVAVACAAGRDESVGIAAEGEGVADEGEAARNPGRGPRS